MTFDEVNKIEVIQNMRKRKSFWRQIREKLEDFSLEVLDKLLDWIKALIEWLGELIAEIAKEAEFYIGFSAVFFFGVGIYLIQETFPMAEEKKMYFSVGGLGTSLGSILLILIQVIKTILEKLGLLEPLIKLRQKILGFLKLL